MGLLYMATSTNTYYFKNKTTVNQSSTFTATNSNVKIFFSDGGYNETTSNLLSLSTTSNLIGMG
jgi:hypothetical protein